MSIWNLIFSDKPDESYEGDSISIIGSKIPTGYKGGGSRGGVSVPKNMAGCLFYLVLALLGMWAMASYSQSLDEPSRVRICDSSSIWPWDSCW